jgi:recombinational DNA repair ATPase RecF
MVAEQSFQGATDHHHDQRQASRYRMMRSLSIENFRSYRELHLSPLRRVNILVGDNGSGKTALLEALFLVWI